MWDGPTSDQIFCSGVNDSWSWMGMNCLHLVCDFFLPIFAVPFTLSSILQSPCTYSQKAVDHMSQLLLCCIYCYFSASLYLAVLLLGSFTSRVYNVQTPGLLPLYLYYE